MGSEWTYSTIADCASEEPFSTQIGPFGNKIKAEIYTPEGAPVLRGTNVNTDSRFNDADFVFIDQDYADSEFEKFTCKAGDVVLCHKGTLGKIGIIPKDSRFETYIMGNSMMKVRTDEEKLNSSFLYYWLCSFEGQDYLFSRVSQVGVPQIQRPLSSLREAEIPLPPLPEQKAIAHILGTLDDKIELNRRMNATLEGMAQALFKSWFVDFDPVIDNALAAGNPIPDELAPRAEVRRQALANGTTQQGSLDHPTLSDPRSLFPAAFQETEEFGWIPEGWEMRAIGDSFQLLGGHSFKSGDYVEDGQFGIVTIKNVQDGSFVQECTNRITEIPGKMKSHCQLNSGDILLSLTGNVGRVCIVSEGDYLLNQRVSKIVGRNGIPEAFGYFFFRQESLYERMITIAKGTAQQNLSPIETAKLEQVMPSNQTIAELGQHFRAYHTKMVGNTAQSQTLTKLRDTLLPKLISGELRLSDAEPLTEEALA